MDKNINVASHTISLLELREEAILMSFQDSATVLPE